MEQVYIARQPILDVDSNIFAYEILYRNANKQSEISSNRYASASVVSTILNKFGTKKLLGNKKAFIKIDEKFLLSDIIFSIPKDFFVFSLFSNMEMSERVVERIEQLKEKGYVLALDNIRLQIDTLTKYESVLDKFSYIKIFIEDYDYTLDVVEKLKSKAMKIIGVKIEDRVTHKQAAALGCDAFEGYYFSKPKIMEKDQYNPSKLSVFRLYNLLMEDVNIDELAAEFENNPEIVVQLLQFINSAAFHFRKKISSIHNVIVLLGRVQLAKWLMLMIYSKSVSSSFETSPLMLMVKNRAELMERILKEIEPNVGSNMLGEAFMVGTLSLMDTLFSIPMEELLENINISEEVKAAILFDEGVFGELYKVIRDMENINIEGIRQFETKYKLPANKLEEISEESIAEVTKLEHPTQSE